MPCCTNKPKYKRKDTTLTSQNNQNNQMIKCVKDLEAKESLFATYLYDDMNKGDLHAEVIDHMDQCLSEVFKCRLVFLNEKSIAIVAAHAFYRSPDLLDEWSKCKFPLFTRLLACYILRIMRRVFEGLHEYGLVELYKQSHYAFEERVVELLEVSYRNNESVTREALKVNYPAVITQRHSSTSACSVQYLLDLAMMGKCEKFLNHIMCRRIANERWTPELSIPRSQFLLSFFLVIPVFFLPVNKTRKALTKYAWQEENKIRRESRRRPFELVANRAERASTMLRLKTAIIKHGHNFKLFYSSPCSKFCLHTTFYFAYIILYTSALLYKSKFDDSTVWRQTLLYIWQFSYIVDMLCSWLNVGIRKFSNSNPADFSHNFFNIVWMILEIISSLLQEFHVATWLWRTLVMFSKLFFLISFIFSSIRIMRVFAADSFFGSIVVMMKKMVHTLWSFFIVFILFWYTYAVAIVSLVEDKGPATHTIAWSLFSNGAFEIFGELKDNIIEGKIDECPTSFNSTDIRVDLTIDCAFRTWLIPILLFVYALVSSILLVNLVTSFFTNTFEQVKDSSTLTYRYKHYQRLVEFERKFWIPAPFSVFYHFPLFIYGLIKTCGECTNTADEERTQTKRKGYPQSGASDEIEMGEMQGDAHIARQESFDEEDTENVGIIFDEDENTGQLLKRIVDFLQESMMIIKEKAAQQEKNADHYRVGREKLDDVLDINMNLRYAVANLHIAMEEMQKVMVEQNKAIQEMQRLGSKNEQDETP